jgi:glycosyltransferase involved in cell wall biosynthesis
MPLVSVIVPAYNAEKTIEKTVSSVLQQTLADLEIIIINDGSTDRTLERLADLEDDRIRIFSFPNSGPQKSRNRGIEQCQGKYLAFLDADDLWTRDKLTDQLKTLQNNPESAMAYSWTDWIDEHDHVWRRGSHLSLSGYVVKRLLLNDFIGSGSNPLILADAVKSVGGFDEEILGGQDWEMWLRIASKYSIVVSPKVHVLYRKSLTSQAWSNNVKRQEMGFRQVVEKTISHSLEELQPLKPRVLGNIYKTLIVDSLERASCRTEAFLVFYFICQALYYDPSLLFARVLCKANLRLISLLLLSKKQYRILVKQLGHWISVEAMYGYMRLI